MTDHDPHTPDRDQWRDRLVDAGLHELADGQRPPDLSEPILAAAATLSTTVTPAGSEAMSEKPARPAPSRFGWKTWAVAATLLVATGSAMLVSQVQPLRIARRVQTEDQTLVRTGAAAPKAARTDGPRIKESVDKLEMLVTPHIIIQEEEEARLGIAVVAGAEPVTNAPASPPSNDAAYPAYSGDLNLPYRQESFGLQSGQKPLAAPLADDAQEGDGGQAASPVTNRYGQPSDGQVAGNGTALRIWHRTRGYDDADGRLNVNAHGTYGYAGKRPFPGDARGRHAQSLATLNEGQGPGQSGDQYARIVDNPFVPVSVANTDHRLSTFSIDVDTASYANVRQFIMQSGALPPPDAVRIEELVNYFQYDYSPPTDDTPFAANVEVGQCPWQPDHRLVRIGIKGREMERRARPQSNLVFLIDVSGSMNDPAKLPLLVEGMRMLTRELGENDRVSIVVYASSEGLALDSTPGTDQSKILAALDQLRAGGSTAGGAGIQLAYQKATEHFIKGGVNRVILCTDGDFNVGVTSPAELERLAEQKAKETGVFLTVLGFGRGNLNDAMMEQISGKGNGNYHYVDSQKEARKVLVEELTGTLVTIAKDVKIQVEFNPAKVAGYRLIGYENRVLAAKDFNDDKKDAGEIGAGHTVTALYEVVPAGMKVEAGEEVDDLKYGEAASAAGGAKEDAKPPSDADAAEELLTLKIRYKQPDGDKSTKLEFPVADDGKQDDSARHSDDFQFAAAVASFGMILRDSPYKGSATLAGVAEIAAAASKDRDPHGYRREFVEIVNRAAEIAGK
jgi:secreted protein with Ig-like and vWFA domain